MCNIRLGRLYDRQQGLCLICGQWAYMGISGNNKKSPTIEHIVPKSDKGSNSESNLCMAHKICNTKRGTGKLRCNVHVFKLLPKNKQKLIREFNQTYGVSDLLSLMKNTQKQKISKNKIRK